MAYVDSTYYTSTYFGQSAGTDFDRLAARASDDIDMATRYNIVLADLDAAQLAMVKKATCAQIENYVINGDGYNDNQVVGSESIGSYSATRNLTQNQKPMALCPRAMAYLEQTGLMFRGAMII
jgi:hypothetical protein